jgi:hypothetical protein
LEPAVVGPAEAHFFESPAQFGAGLFKHRDPGKATAHLILAAEFFLEESGRGLLSGLGGFEVYFFYGFKTDSGCHICSLGVFVELHRGIQSQEFFGTATEITISPISFGLADLAIAGEIFWTELAVNPVGDLLAICGIG